MRMSFVSCVYRMHTLEYQPHTNIGTLTLDKNENLTKKDLRFTKHTTTSMQDMIRENKSQRALWYRAKEKECGLGGVLVSDEASETLLRVRPIRAMLCDRGTGATRKAFHEDEDVVLACMALRRHPTPDRRLVETEENNVKTRFPIGSSVVCLQPGTWCRARIFIISLKYTASLTSIVCRIHQRCYTVHSNLTKYLECYEIPRMLRNTSNVTRSNTGTESFGAVGTVQAVDLKRNSVQLRLVTRPQLPPFGFRIVKAVKDKYTSVRALCRELKISYGVLLKITGSIMVKEKGTSYKDRTDVGLNFRVFGRLVVPGFMRARDCVKKSSIKNAWLNPFDTMQRVKKDQSNGQKSHEWYVFSSSSLLFELKKNNNIIQGTHRRSLRHCSRVREKVLQHCRMREIESSRQRLYQR